MDNVITSKTGRQCTLTLNRPDARNALNSNMIAGLLGALRDVASDESVRVVVIRGAGSAFSAGADLAELREMKSASLQENLDSSTQLARLYTQIRRYPKPVIAQVNGPAIAGGCGLVVACDLAIASAEATFGFPEVRIGFVPALVSNLLRGRISDYMLRDLLLTGRIFDSQEARRIGIIGGVSDSGELDDKVSDLVDSICSTTSPAAVALTKRMLFATAGLPPVTASEVLASYNVLARQTQDVQRGIAAFLDKRKIEW